MPSAYIPAPDLSRYVALGDSITAGYMDGALYYEGQQNSYARLVANQLDPANASNFTQPLLSPVSVGVDLMGNSRLTLRRKTGEPEVLELTYLAPHGDQAALLENSYATRGPFRNMGVPGAKAITTVLPGFGNPANGAGYYNPFFTRMASNCVSASVLSDALQSAPTFFSIFIGNNDALAYALAGCTENALSPPKGPAGQGFEGSLLTIVEALTAGGAEGVIANLPSIANIPYFTSIPYDGLRLDANQAQARNIKYRAAGITFSEGDNAFVVSDPSVPNAMRPAEKGERILMDLILDPDAHSYLQGEKALPKKYTLSSSEALRIEKTLEAYNAIISAIAHEKRLGLVDIHQLVKSATPDRYYNPASLSLNYTKKGVFSLDGLHPNSFGQALLANEFIKTIHLRYGISVPTIRSHRYKGISFPE